MRHVLSAKARRVGLSLIVAAGSILVVPEATAESQSYPTSSVPVIDWTACDSEFQCASVAVPLDYDRPYGAKISLALIRLPATDPAHRKGSLFVNPGGPGGSGVDAVRSKGTSYPAEVRAAFDLIGFDPRGIAGSTPIRCFTNPGDAEAATQTLAFPLTGQQRQDWEKIDRRFVDGCAANAGPIVGHMSTANVARDLDLLRRAVGDARLNYVGFSYGSYLGQTYANMFPRNVGAFVIDGVLDPIAWSTGYGNQSRRTPFTARLNSAKGGEQTLSQFFMLCDQAADACAFSGGARARFDALAVQLKVTPVAPYPEVPDFFIGYDGLMSLTSGAMYRPISWPDLAVFLTKLEAGSTAAAAIALDDLRIDLGVEDSTAGGEDPTVGDEPAAGAAVADATAAATPPSYPQFEGQAAVTCDDTDNPRYYSAWNRTAEKQAKLAPHFGRLWTWQSSVCHFWPGNDSDRYTGPWNARTANPVLIVGNYYDPSTPYSGAVTASRLLKGSRLLSYAGWGHLAFGVVGNECIDTAVVRYLVDDVLPPKGTVCQPTGSPFDVDTAIQSRATAAQTFQTSPLPDFLTRAVAGA